MQATKITDNEALICGVCAWLSKVTTIESLFIWRCVFVFGGPTMIMPYIILALVGKFQVK